ncbi:Cobalt-precorrin 5A hydrolase [hydrothermal vent metagenome]|uniref:Cobalt-precorrin 5A hydrolase n=1 Tax=hydrothermal vent metagenome TaxID=652676 RepID=A0A3B1CMC6_9ZZZZ
MKLAFITLSNEGAKVAVRAMGAFTGASLFAHDKVSESVDAIRFSSVIQLTGEVFDSYDGLVYIAPCGAVVRAVSRYVQNKKSDPAVVVLDVGARYAISLLGGHEGGANKLAIKISNAISAEPVITTTTEAVKNIIVGVGMRRGKGGQEIVSAIKSVLEEAGISLGMVRYIASVDIKSDEAGLIEAAAKMDMALRFIASDEIRESTRSFEKSEFVQSSVNLPAVAEPAALLAGRRTKLILAKRKINGITVALAKESCLSLE